MFEKVIRSFWKKALTGTEPPIFPNSKAIHNQVTLHMRPSSDTWNELSLRRVTELCIALLLANTGGSHDHNLWQSCAELKTNKTTTYILSTRLAGCNILRSFYPHRNREMKSSVGCDIHLEIVHHHCSESSIPIGPLPVDRRRLKPVSISSCLGVRQIYFAITSIVTTCETTLFVPFNVPSEDRHYWCLKKWGKESWGQTLWSA